MENCCTLVAVHQDSFMISKVSVLYFAKGAELTGVKSETLSFPSELTTLQLWQELEKKHPKLCVLREQVVLAVRQEYVALGDQTVSLCDGDEVAVIPPLSGGMAEDMDSPQDLIKLTHEKLSPEVVSNSVTCPSCGAITMFIGTTRDNFDGKKVIRLEYEAYIPMAELEMKKICSSIRAKWPTVKHISVQHRLGVVPVTEASVIVGISSPHRADSLEAVSFCIDSLKANVPIWKKEVYETEEASWKQNKECLWSVDGKK